MSAAVVGAAGGTAFERAAAVVDRRFDEMVEELRACARIASVSAEASPGLEEMSAWLAERLEQLGFSVESVPVPGHAPVVIGRLPGAGPRRLLLYSHYDVQPAEPRSAWSRDPFAAELEGGVVYARGIVDDKADVASRLHALRAWQESSGELPFEVVWLSEGAEEIGSPGLETVCREHASTLRADGCLWESYLRRADGTPEIAFGCKGLLYLQLRVRLLAADQHSSFAPVFRSAPVRLVQALATLVAEDGRPAVDGLAATFDPPGEPELEQLEALELPDDSAARLEGASPFFDAGRLELLERLLYEPSINLSGLSAGFQGAGSKTVLPADASAKVDIRLVPGQSPAVVAALVRAHLDRRGFGDVSLEVVSSVEGARSSPASAVGAAVIRAARDVLG
ncbi:MAG TPA: M20/M25/M40 family metallo-hydrolase, partial [Acidimicrobiales bacterium]|nr:M20/M25/M40 family metallo-hydrolase [Acidimicrobiales bacterium]